MLTRLSFLDGLGTAIIQPRPQQRSGFFFGVRSAQLSEHGWALGAGGGFKDDLLEDGLADVLGSIELDTEGQMTVVQLPTKSHAQARPIPRMQRRRHAPFECL